jgi:hypothetical protein
MVSIPGGGLLVSKPEVTSRHELGRDPSRHPTVPGASSGMLREAGHEDIRETLNPCRSVGSLVRTTW